MADNKISVEIVQKPLEQGKAFFDQIQAAHGFEGKAGQTAQTKASGLWQIIEQLMQKTNLTREEFDKLVKSSKEFFGILETYSTHIADLSAETKKALETLKTATDKKDQIDKAVDKKEIEVANKRKALADKYQNVELHKFTKEGKLSKQPLTNWDTIAENIKQGNRIGYTDDQGNIVEINKEASELSTSYVDAAAELNTLKQAAKDAATNLTQASNAFKQSAAKDTKTNKQGGQTYVDVVNASTELNKDIKEGYSQLTQEDVKDIESHTPGPKNSDDIKKKEPSGFGRLAKQFTIYAVAMRAAKSAIREAVGTIKELDKSLTEQAMVTGKTRKETYALVGSYQELAKATASTTKEVAQVATEYMKQGKSTKEALVLTEAAISAAKVARVSVGDSVNYLTTALNGFRLSADQAMAVSDKFAAVAASSATDYDELAIALSKVASQANLAGMSIDYTTALLTKGLETTREAPETMGTALKTVIARMREIKDYGETLEGDTNINNVEKQLATVQIHLRDQKGELRSTQDVLDELGNKWDTLNKNQQAAIAKALAGTRQQSRLIAMMEGYERVTELQQIAERSQGATYAQMGTHLEGMEAALNRVKVAWESIVTTITDSELIISLVDGIANLLDRISQALENQFVQGTALIGLGTIILGHYITKYETQKLHNRAILQENKEKNQTLILQKKQDIATKQALLRTLQDLKANEALTHEMIVQTAIKEGMNLEAAEAFATSYEQRTKDLTLEQQRTMLSQELVEDQLQLDGLYIDQAKNTIQLKENAAGLASIWGKVLGILTPILTIMSLINTAKMISIGLSKQQAKEDRKGLLVAVKNMWANIVSSFKGNPVKVGIGLALATAAAIALGVGISAAFSNTANSEEKAAEDINEMSNQIYKLNEKANALAEVSRKFDDIDNKVLKTSKDMKEMNSLLDSAADKLSEEEKADFNLLTTPEQKATYLKEVEKNARAEARAKQKEQIAKVKENRSLLTSDDPEALKVQTAMKVAANSKLYEVIDSTTDLTKEQAHATEQLTAAILAEMTAEEALEYADDNDNMKRLIDLTSQHAAVLQDEEESLINRRQAYLDMLGVLNEDQVALQKFKSAYKEWEFFADMSDQALQFIDDMKLSNDAVNDLFNSGTIFNKKMAQYAKENKIEWSNIDTEQFKTQLTNALDDINTDFSNFEEVLEDNFKDIIDVTDKNGAEWNALVESIGDQFGTSVLNMGQNMTKFKNNINSFYENANKWTDLSEDKKAEFISENADLFKGQQGAELLEALQNNDYERMEAALQNSDVMKENRKTQLEEVNRTLQIELAKGEEAQNKAYIKQLEDHKKFLEDDKNLYKVSIKTRLEQQEKQLSEYKNMLQKEHEALQKSLDKRKEAYQKYFDTINEQKDDEEYEEQAQLLVANISKLGSDSTGTAAAQRADLEKQLQELEKERLEELRQHAQEKVMENLDKQVEEINEKFDKLIDSNHELLLAMQHDLDSTKGKAQFLTDLLNTKAASGATDIEMQNYLQDLRGSFGGQFSGLWDKLDIKESNGNLYLNVNGQEVLLNQNDQQSVFEAVMQALRAIGK